MTTRAPVSGTGKRILYIEQSEECRDMLTTLLVIAGYAVATAATAIDGVRLARVERFDLFILESRFPDGNGANVCGQIRAFDSETPILFFSSSAYDHDISAGMAAGAQGYLTKPEGIQIIEQTIAELLAGQRYTGVCALKKAYRLDLARLLGEESRVQFSDKRWAADSN